LKRAIDTSLLGPGGGLLNAEQATAFLNLVNNVAVMSPLVRTEIKMNSTGEISKMDISEPVTEGATENTDTGRIFEPTFTKLTYAVRKLRSAYDITTESLEDSITGAAGLRATIVKGMSERIADDQELLRIQGNTTTYAATNTRTGRLLRVCDGWGVLSDSGNIVDAAGAGLSRNLLSRGLRALPARYMGSRTKMRWWAAPAVCQDWVDTVAGRLTNAGDSALLGQGMYNGIPPAFGVPFVEVPHMPITETYTSGSDSYTDASYMWLAVPTNFVIIIQRKIEVYWEFIPRRDSWEATIYTRQDMLIENVDALVKITNLRVGTDLS
jgi:HK97 family phage major capsid protein